MAIRRKLALPAIVILLFIQIVHSQDNTPPVFQRQQYIYQVDEDHTPGTDLDPTEPIVATDLDGDPVMYFIQPNSLNSNHFGVRTEITGPGSQGILYLLNASSLDDFGQETLTVFVMATDNVDHGGTATQTEVSVYVIDINNNSPDFSNLDGAISVSENTNTEVVVFDADATDGDHGANALILYYINSIVSDLGTNSTDLFDININNGRITLVQSLDYDGDGTEYTIIVRAEDRGAVPLSSIAILTVNVQDENDNPPFFDPMLYVTNIHENLTFDDFVVTVSAFDGDRGVDDVILYSIALGNLEINGTESFAIGNESGVITVNVSSLDRETHAQYTLAVEASELNDPSMVTQVSVQINIVDINDNSPTFDQDVYSGNVSETAADNTLVVRITAMDPDEGTHGQFTFTLVNAVNISLPVPFRVDHDEGNGDLVVDGDLDYETTTGYTLWVLAEEVVNNEPKTGTAMVTIVVVNENDNAPIFRNGSYSASVSENVHATGVIMVTADDIDSGTFGEVIYSLDSGHMNMFSIDNVTGEVRTTQMIDYEINQQFFITIIASDQAGNQQRMDEATLTVDIINRNDEPPVFVMDVNGTQVEVTAPLEESVTEELNPGIIVIFLEVVDNDDGLTPLTFTLLDEGNELGHFVLDTDVPGLIKTNATLDHDRNDVAYREYSLRVTVNDTVHGDLVLVNVQVIDINDNNPEFSTPSYYFSVSENRNASTFVGQVEATDLDSGLFGTVTYQLDGVGAERFTINETTGGIFTAVVLNREDVSDYNLVVTAMDLDPSVGGRRETPVPVIISVLDENDNPPVFDMPLAEHAIIENTDLVNIDVRATDRDSGPNGMITYQIIGGNTNNTFTVADPTVGVVSRNASSPLQRIDRETVSSYRLVIEAADGGNPEMTATAVVLIDILDQNDETPQFPQTQYSMSIREDLAPGSTVIRLEATDDDDGANAVLTYTIMSQSGGENFELNPTTGDVTTLRSFNRETFEGPYTVIVLVQDGGIPANNGTTTLIVSVLDVNDNTPKFLATSYGPIDVTEEENNGEFVVQVVAMDEDEPSTNNSLVTYSIVNVIVTMSNSEIPFPGGLDADYHFRINSTTGLIHTNVSLDRESIQSYTIEVTATDMGPNPLSSSVLVSVDVVDINDNRPYFTEPMYTFNISESTSVNTRFTSPQIQATDLDDGTNAVILYFTNTSGVPFTVDFDSGDLILISALSFTDEAEYVISVIASDDSVPPQTDMTTVIVNVVDVNNKGPVFIDNSVTATLREGNYTTEIVNVLNVTATDEDSGLFGQVIYSIDSINVEGIFEVEMDTGMVWVIGNVDRETTTSYSFTILAEDGGNPPRLATADVTVILDDVNDNSPMFSQASYEGSVEEGLSAGTTVNILRVSASDVDQEENAVITYSISGTTFFQITDPTSGWISTNTSFNYEDPAEQQFTFTVIARDNSTTDPRLESSATVTIRITDINDNPPIFSPLPSQPLNLLEDSQLSNLVCCIVAVDMDSGSNAEIQYQLSGDEGKFQLHPNGTLALVSALDYENTASYNITITATDGGQPARTDVSFFQVNVEDVNDEVPQFDQSTYSALVAEDTESTTTIVTMVVTDRDSGNGGTVFCTIESGNDDNKFIITRLRFADRDQWECYISLFEELNFEETTSYALTILARDNFGAVPFNSAETSISITVRDTNDNHPVFSLPTGYVFQVLESTGVDAAFGTVVATDEDGGSAGILRYSLADGTDSAVLSNLALDTTTGVISVKQELNFETQSVYTFTVVARDISSSPLNTSVQVRVEVLDTNEFAPVFQNLPYEASVQEGGTSPEFVFRVNATDSSESGSDSITYEITIGDLGGMFAIDPMTGEITTSQTLDREQTSVYVLTVAAVDEGDVPLTSLAQVTVTVVDINDNPPDFGGLESFEYTNLPEGSPAGTTLSPILTAEDLDEGENGEVTYSLVGTVPFEVDPESGEIFVMDGAVLNREVQSNYVFQVQATDNGASALNEAIDITVILADVNDNDPAFGQPGGYTAGVKENSPQAVSVVTVIATDADGDAITYSIVSGDDDFFPKFIIDTDSGLIQTTSNQLNREISGTYVLTVSATDDGNPQNSANVEVTLTVEDVNDNTPMFSEPQYSFTVNEGNDRDIVITQFEATDGDAGINSMVTFRFAPGSNQDGIFSLNSQGELFALEGLLDYEMETIHTLGVIAEDQATTNKRSSSATVTVTLTDVNDNDPAFTAEVYTGQVFENANATVNDTVLVVMATDADTGSNAELSFTFQNPTGVFSISSNDGRSAIVTVSGSIDAESIPSYNLVVQATDGGSPPRVGTATVLIDVIDVNDNKPRFDRSFYMEAVLEDVNEDTEVATVSAIDPDGSPLTYSITDGDDDRRFKIDLNTGVILTADTLNREDTSVFDLTVTATDDGTPPQIGTATVQITVEDINDEAPEFTADVYLASLAENSAQGTQIQPVDMNGVPIRIEARDDDEPNTQNSRVLYSLQGENSDLFNIDFDTGIVTVARGTDLDREDRLEIVVTIVARDSVPAPDTLSSTALLRITLEDENDVAPMFGQPNGYAIAIAEDANISAVIRIVDATDPDEDSGGEVAFAITSASPVEVLGDFSITTINSTDPGSGEVTYLGMISLASQLDREEEDIITLRVTATDRGVPVLSSLVTVQVTVTDINDNRPIFGEDIYTTIVSELLPVGASAFQVVAYDPDVSFNAQVLYSILESSGGLFSVNTDTGVITSTGQLDHETQQSHTITIQACDSGVPQMCANTTVILNIEDANDEVPAFDFTPYRVDICEDYTAMTTVVQPVATDADSGTNAEIAYSLQDEPAGLFRVNPGTGQIYLLRDIDSSEVGAEYTFTIVATDSGTTPQSGEAAVIVRVLNCTALPFRFNTSYFQFSVSENQQTFEEVLEILPLAASVVITISPTYDSNPFEIVISSGDHELRLTSGADLVNLGLSTGTGIDRERRAVFTIIIAAASPLRRRQASNPTITYSSVTVNVVDVDDNRPVFDADFYRFIVREGEASASVGTVTATDSDSGPFGEVLYGLEVIVPTSAQFEVNSTTGEITTSSALDREAVGLYTLEIRADDSMSGPTTTVEVIVQDINDVTPNFTVPVYVAPVVENVPEGTSVVTVRAEDTDSGNNGMVTYSIVSGDIGVLDLDPVTGVVTTLTELNYESETVYTLRVDARDQGSPQLSSEVSVIVEVQDFNDNTPEFVNPPTSRSILENATVGSVLYTFVVTDLDSGINGVNGTRFSIIAGDIHNLFAIGPESGVLKTTGSLDRERQDGSLYDLQIQARDQEGVGGEALTSVTQLRVTVQDVNDHSPVFVEDGFSTTISEGEDLDQTILDVPATDRDSGTNGEIVYSLEDDFGIFVIETVDGTGELQLFSSLNREIRDSYTLTVTARDRGAEPRSNSTTIEITVSDVNDNTPVIANIESGVTNCVEISEDAVNGPFFTANATDEDDGLNGMVVFSLETTVISLPFGISSAGAISKQGELDYEDQNEYTLVVRAVDQGVPPLTGIATLCVRVLDENDNDPMCAEATYDREQMENTPLATVLTVTGTDADQTGSDNAFISYSLEGNAEALATFAIDNATGAITNRVELDRETHPSNYNLTVVLTNSRSQNMRTGECTVTVKVLDDNDEIPEFGQIAYSASLSELAPVGTAVINITAFDADQAGHPNSQLSFSLVRLNNNPFHIDPNTGDVTVLNSLDYEVKTQYQLTVRVEDKGIPQTSRETNLAIELLDENDEPPQFIFPAGQNAYVTSLSELTTVNVTNPYLLATVEYGDEDGPANRDSEVKKVEVLGPSGEDITDGRENLFYVVNDPAAMMAQVWLNGSLDHEDASEYLVWLDVENTNFGVGELCGSSPMCKLSDTTFLQVMVVDENDNPPMFDRISYSAEVSTTADQGTSILTVTATDADSGDFGVVRYEVIGGEGRFRIDLETGTIFTRTNLESLDGETILFTVRASDNLDRVPSLSTDVPITLLVLNDFRRIRIVFDCDIDTVTSKEDIIKMNIEEVSGLNVVVEGIEPGNDGCTNFTFHAIDQTSNDIIDYLEFVDRTDQDRLIQLLTTNVCGVKRIEPSAGPAQYLSDLDTPTTTIIVLCALLTIGAAVLLFLAFRQRYVAQHKVRSKLLANVFYGTPPSASMIENITQQDFELQALERGHHNKDNPMFVDPYDNWTGIDTSGADSVADGSTNRDNPLYEEQEIRMEMFASDSDESDDDDVGNEAELLAAALQDDEDEDSEEEGEEGVATVTAI